MRGARNLRNEAYIEYAAVTKVEGERSRWTFLLCNFMVGIAQLVRAQDCGS